METSKISVITPVFNAAATLQDCILSVANQNYPNLEHWFIDGLSTDGSLEIIKRYTTQFPHVKFVSEKDKGIYDAMNKGIDLSEGEWIYFLGADDVLVDSILDEITPWIFSDCDFLYGNVAFKHSGELFKGDIAVQSNFKDVAISHQGVFTRRRVFESLGKYKTEYKVYADTVFHLEIMHTLHIKKAYIDKTIAIFNESGVSSFFMDERYLHGKPRLLSTYMNVKIDVNDYYKSISKYIFYEIYAYNWKKGVKNAFIAAYRTKDVRFWLINSAYWLKKRYLRKNK